MCVNLRIIIVLWFLGSMSSLSSQGFWEELYFPDTTDIYCLATNMQGHIFIGTGHNINGAGIYRSTDGGISWSVVYDLGSFNVNSMGISDSGLIYVGKTGGSRLIISEDNGDTWSNLSVPPPSNGNIVEIFCLGEDSIFLSSWESEGGLISRSYDRGLTWTSTFVTNNANEYITDIGITNDAKIFVCLTGFFPDQGGVYCSEDYGNSWKYIGLFNHQVNALGINSSNDVFTCDWWVLSNGEIPGIHGMYNGTQTFEYLSGAVDGRDILIDPNDIIYVAAGGSVLRSFDNGQSFEFIEDSLSAYMRILCLDSEGYLYAARHKLLIRSINPIVNIGEDVISRFISPFQVFPNPAHDILTIDIEKSYFQRDMTTIQVVSLSGIGIYETNCKTERFPFTFGIGHLPTGVYFVQLGTNNISFSTKFIKY